MKNKLLEMFRLHDQIEEPQIVIDRITMDSIFKGTNIWVLIFAIFIASLGLNINSTAVIIGAMLISPLMGPIMGIGLGVAINDLHLAKEAIKNFSFAVFVGLVTSFIYFSVTPLNDAYSELLARTTPTIYDVLIALFGGLAGIVANSSKHKGNVIPGVAIATALMPPLCTAGYGLATLQFNYFLGAIYLFTINTVFIALATFVTIKLLKYPIKHLSNPISDKRSIRLIWGIIAITVIPSIYFGYEMIVQNKFTRNSNLFIESQSSIEGSYLLNKTINPQKKSITLIYGGKDLTENQIKNMEDKLEIFGLKGTSLNIKQGISFLPEVKMTDRMSQLTKMMDTKEILIRNQTRIIDSFSSVKRQTNQILKELKLQYPEIASVSIRPYIASIDSTLNKNPIVLIQLSRSISNKATARIIEWLQVRLDIPKLRLKQFR